MLLKANYYFLFSLFIVLICLRACVCECERRTAHALWHAKKFLVPIYVFRQGSKKIWVWIVKMPLTAGMHLFLRRLFFDMHCTLNRSTWALSSPLLVLPMSVQGTTWSSVFLLQSESEFLLRISYTFWWVLLNVFTQIFIFVN